MTRLVALSALALLGACFNPQFNAPSCGPNDECPPGSRCEADVCVAGNGTIDADPGAIDAAIDGTPPPDADPTGCYQEANDGTNGQTAEVTGKNVPQDVAIICGTFEDRPPDAQGIIDADTYTVTGAASQSYGIRISAPGSAAYDLGVMLLGTPTAGGVSTFGWTAGDIGLITVTSMGTSISIQVAARGTAQLGQTIPYEIKVELLDTAVRCPVGTAVVGETLDTPANTFTGNDVLAFGMLPTVLPTLTADATDAPESVTLASTVSLTGSVDIAHPLPVAPEIYRDRDTYAVTIPASVRSVDLLVTYPGAEDLDFWMVRASDLHPQAVGFNVGAEKASFNVSAGMYLVMVGHYNAGANATQPYTLTLCTHAEP